MYNLISVVFIYILIISPKLIGLAYTVCKFIQKMDCKLVEVGVLTLVASVNEVHFRFNCHHKTRKFQKYYTK